MDCNTDNFTELKQFSDTTADQVLKENISQIMTLYNNAKFYFQSAELNGALVSYSCAAVLLDTVRRTLLQLQPQSKSSPPSASQSPPPPPQGNDEALTECEKMLNCCLNAVEELQKRVRTSKSSGGNKDDEEVKNWEKICIKNQPLT